MYLSTWIISFLLHYFNRNPMNSSLAPQHLWSRHLLCPSLGMLSHWYSHLPMIIITPRTHILHLSQTAPLITPLSPLACSCSSPPTLWHHWSQWSHVNAIFAITNTCLPLSFSYIRSYVLMHVLYKWEVIIFDNHLWNKLDSWVLTPLKTSVWSSVVAPPELTGYILSILCTTPFNTHSNSLL